MREEVPDPADIELDVQSYEACGGTEHFLSYEDSANDLLVGFCRLRYPGEVGRRGLEDAALVRELHVYGNEVGVGVEGEEGADFQHQGYGRKLLAKAEAMATEDGYGTLSVISGIGAREYYREKLGYHQDGPYVSKRL